MRAEVIPGDCRNVLPALPAGGFDVVFTDPPYPEISRAYGHWTEAEWFALMRAVVPEVRRVLKPSGSAVFVLQPNSERVGRMRTWLWEFLAWVGREWNVVQDAYWWNTAALPTEMATHQGGLRPSLKTCVWCGPPDCRRDQGAVLWRESDHHVGAKAAERLDHTRRKYPSGSDAKRATILAAAQGRGGVTPFNVLPVPHQHSNESKAVAAHGARTPLALCSWWIRYLCPPGGAVLDPFAGSGTAGVAALRHGASFTGIECVAEYVDMARKRLDAERAKTPLFAGLP